MANQPAAPQLDTLFVSGLEVETIIGVFDWEREVEQLLVFDVQLQIDMRTAARTDDVNDALSYVDVAEEISRVTRECAAKLLEHLAAEIADALFAKWPIASLRLRITKPTAVPAASGVGVEIVRDRPAATGPTN